MLPNYGMDLFSSLWDVLLPAVMPLCRQCTPRQGWLQCSTCVTGLRVQGTDPGFIIPFCWIKQNEDSVQLCKCSWMCFIGALGLQEGKR